MFPNYTEKIDDGVLIEFFRNTIKERPLILLMLAYGRLTILIPFQLRISRGCTISSKSRKFPFHHKSISKNGFKFVKEIAEWQSLLIIIKNIEIFKVFEKSSREEKPFPRGC